MLEMHKLTRYEHAPVLKFGVGFDARADAVQLATWLSDFCSDKGKPPKLLSFTFHAADEHADDVCHFMKAIVGLPEVAKLFSSMRVELVFAGAMSDDMCAQTQDRMLTQQF